MYPRKIAVVGAGVAGLACASFLKAAGHDVIIFDRAAEPRPEGAGLIIQPTGLACLAELGLDDEIINQGARLTKITGYSHRGETVLDIGHGDVNERLFSVGLHRGILFSALYNRAVNQGVSFRSGFDACRVGQTNSGIILHDSKDRSSERFSFIVDASGIGSKIRKSVGVKFRSSEYDYGALWGVANDNDGRFDHSRLEQRYRHASEMNGILPLGVNPQKPEDKLPVAFFSSIKQSDYNALRQGGFESWKKRCVDLWPKSGSIVKQFRNPDDLFFSRYSDTTLSRRHEGNVVFIGDSAHGTSPQLGQGANLALADALVFSRSLQDSEDFSEAVRSYESQRKNHQRFYQFASRILTPFFQSDSLALPFLRDKFMAASSNIPYIRRQMVLSFTGVKDGIFTNFDPGDWNKKYKMSL